MLGPGEGLLWCSGKSGQEEGSAFGAFGARVYGGSMLACSRELHRLMGFADIPGLGISTVDRRHKLRNA